MPRRFKMLLLLLIVGAGVGIRLYHLTDPPLDFHPTRQMHSALIARQFYLTWRPGDITEEETLQRALGGRMARYEPPLFEALVARTGVLLRKSLGFQLWFARVYDLLFWLLGGWGLYRLARYLIGDWGAVTALAYWWLLPFAIQASRSFQPDPLMTVLLVWTAYAAFRGADRISPSWKWWSAAVALGAAAGIVKIYAVLFALGILTAAAWQRSRHFWRQRAFWLAVVGVTLPVAVVYALMPHNTSVRDFLKVYLWLSPKFYGGWLTELGVFGGACLLVALAGIAFGGSRLQALAWGWGGAYLLYGFTVPYHIATHSYYHLPLLPLAALGIGSAVEALRPALPRLARPWRVALALGALAAVVYPLGITAWEAQQCTCRQEAATFRRLGAVLPRDGAIIALTPAYGYPLMYYANVSVSFWPTSRYQQAFSLSPDDILQKLRNFSYFLVTDFCEFDRQPTLRHYLATHYPILMEGEGFALYDLRHPLDTQP